MGPESGVTFLSPPLLFLLCVGGEPADHVQRGLRRGRLQCDGRGQPAGGRGDTGPTLAGRHTRRQDRHRRREQNRPRPDQDGAD